MGSSNNVSSSELITNRNKRSVYKVIQANLQRKKLALKELLQEGHKRGTSFAIVQEPYVGSVGEITPASGFRVIQRTQNRVKPVKSAIVVFDDQLEILECPELTTENIVVMILKSMTSKIGVVSVYFEDSLPIEPYLTHIKMISEKLSECQLIIGGDVNAWSPWWGSRSENQRGKLMMGIIDELNMHILNEGTAPTFYTIRNNVEFKSNVDVTACSQEIMTNIDNWKVNTDLTSADHNAITFSINLNKPLAKRPIKSTRKYNTKKANWQLFRQQFRRNLQISNVTEQEIEKLDRKEEIENIIIKYTGCITDSSEIAIPKKNKKTKYELPWWTEQLGKLKKDMMTKKRRISCAAPSRREYVVNEYLKAKEKYELEALEAQTSSWKLFCGAQDRESIWDGVYKVIRKTARRHEDQPLVHEGKLLSPEESVELLATTFFPKDTTAEDQPVHTELRSKAEKIEEYIENDIQDPSFTNDELRHVISSFNPKKSPGSDGLTADICVEAIRAEEELFLKIMNKCLDIAHFPKLWKEATVIVLRKAGKTDFSHTKSYRPIGLLPILGKILEKLIIIRIRWHLLPKANPRQYGFIPQRSTEDSLYDLIQHIRNNLNSKLINVVVSLDIEGAFDSAWWPSIKNRLMEKGCPQNLRRIANSYFQDRKVCVRYADREYTTETSQGCVQGSVGGPTFWNLLLDPLLDEVERFGVHCQAFADDIVLVFSGHSVHKIEEQADLVLTRVYEWGKINKLKFAPHKTCGMVITRKLKYDTPRIRMGNVIIALTDEIKILGLIIDKKLTFKNHIKYICAKALNIYKPLARSAKISWGLNPEIIRTIYVAVIEPIILYAASVWAPAGLKKYIRDQLNSIQRSFALKICRAYRTVSLTAALLLAKLIPLDLRVQEMAKLYEAKRGKPQDIINNGTAEKRISFLKAPHPALERIHEFGKVEDLSADTTGRHNMTGLMIFTDGSKMDEQVGAALTCWEDGVEIMSLKFHLASYCTVFQAELYALYHATEVAIKSTERQINILSDSRSGLELIRNPRTYHPLAFGVRERLREAEIIGKNIRLFWVRAHVGVEGNERADHLAKEAAQTANLHPDYDVCPISYIKRMIRQESIRQWDQRYKDSSTASLTKVFFPGVVGAYKTLRKIKLTPTIVQTLTGHGGFGQYLYRFKCKESPVCDCDDETEESVLHILIDCPKFAVKRMDLELSIGIRLSKDSLPAIIASKNANRLLKFFEEVTSKVKMKNKTRN